MCYLLQELPPALEEVRYRRVVVAEPLLEHCLLALVPLLVVGRLLGHWKLVSRRPKKVLAS